MSLELELDPKGSVFWVYGRTYDQSQFKVFKVKASQSIKNQKVPTDIGPFRRFSLVPGASQH